MATAASADEQRYTCITCHVMFSAGDSDGAFAAADLQKQHYKSDWHRYNLKRKVADLPPVTAESFQERVLAQREQASQQEVDTSCSCRVCGKHFSTANAFENHQKSKKHREAVAKAEAELPEDVQRRNAKNMALNVQNQKRAEKDEYNARLRDGIVGASQTTGSAAAAAEPSSSSGHKTEEAMDEDDDDSSEESWEGEALGVEQCLFCPFVSASLDDNVHHMTIAHSFFIPDIEYLTDLDGLISYLGQKVGEMHMCLWCGDKSRLFLETKAVQQHMTDKGHCKLFHDGDAVLEYADFYDYRKSYPDYKEGEDAAVADTDGAEEEDEEEVVEPAKLEESGYQLMLPSGATVGHRSLMRYYKQKLRPDRQLALPRNASAISRVVAHYKALGWTGTTGAAAEAKAKDIAYVRRLQSRQWTHLGVKSNRLQKHFRDQVFGF